VNGRPRGNVVAFQRLVIGQLLSAVNQFDLVYLNALLFLQGLFDRQDLIFRFKIERLLAPRQGFNEDLE